MQTRWLMAKTPKRKETRIHVSSVGIALCSLAEDGARRNISRVFNEVLS